MSRTPNQSIAHSSLLQSVSFRRGIAWRGLSSFSRCSHCSRRHCSCAVAPSSLPSWQPAWLYLSSAAHVFSDASLPASCLSPSLASSFSFAQSSAWPSAYATPNSAPRKRAKTNEPETPNHALQRTAPRVTLAAADHPAVFAHPAPRRLSAASSPRSAVLSLGSLGHFTRLL